MPPEVGARTFDVLKGVPPNRAPGPEDSKKFSKSAIGRREAGHRRLDAYNHP